MIKVTATIIGKEGATGYIHGATQKEVWAQLEHKLKLDQTVGIQIHTQRTRRVSGSNFRYRDPANPANEQNGYQYYIVTKQYTQAQDFTTELNKKKTTRDDMFAFLQTDAKTKP